MPTIGTRFHAVGEPAHRDRAEHEERRRRGADEDDRALADAERPLDLGPEHVDRRALELVEREQEPEHDEHELAADRRTPRVKRHRRGVDARQQVVGEDDLLPGALLRLLAVRPPRRARRPRARPRCRRRVASPSTPLPPERNAGLPRCGAYRVRTHADSSPWLLSTWWHEPKSTPRPTLHRARVGGGRRGLTASTRAPWHAGPTRSPHCPTRPACSSTGKRPTAARNSAAARTSSPRGHAELWACCAPDRSSTSRAAARRTGGALQGEDQLQAARRCRVLSASRRPAYPMISTHVSAMVAIDDADETNGSLEVVSDHFDSVLPTDERWSCSTGRRARSSGTGRRCRPGATLWFHSRTPHRSGANHSSRPRGRSTPLTTPPRGRPQRPSTTRPRRPRLRRDRTGNRALRVVDRRLRRSAGMKVV